MIYEENDDNFNTLSRQKFRKYFQPSRVLIGVFSAPTGSGFNPITVCFAMYCSYKPVMMAIAIHNINATFDLLNDADQYTLVVPGESMAEEALYCGTVSMRQADKIVEAGIKLTRSKSIQVPGFSCAIANIELSKVAQIVTGDHTTLIGKVLNINVNTKLDELPLLSVGPNTQGYRVLAHKGIHRLGVVRK